MWHSPSPCPGDGHVPETWKQGNPCSPHFCPSPQSLAQAASLSQPSSVPASLGETIKVFCPRDSCGCACFQRKVPDGAPVICDSSKRPSVVLQDIKLTQLLEVKSCGGATCPSPQKVLPYGCSEELSMICPGDGHSVMISGHSGLCQSLPVQA